MAVLLDPPRWPAHATLWSHLVSDASLAELHDFAYRAGLPARAFERDHYDVPAARYQDLLDQGARAVAGRDLVRRLRASGLRRTPVERAAAAQRLLARWSQATADPSLAGAGGDLLARWLERGRLHHGVTHLREVLDAVEVVAGREGAPRRSVRVARLGAWFHDAVHTSGLGSDQAHPHPSGSDEQASAALAAAVLAADPDVAHVVDVVLMTSGHRPAPGDVAGAILSDADLSVLGASPQRYADYAAAIRQEYAAIPPAAFRAGRAQILTGLLDGPLFHTASGRALWEASARRNLAAELARLQAEASAGADLGRVSRDW